MPSLKDYRNRIASVKSTRKITSAMKMVAASKLRRAQEAAMASQPYAKVMASMLARVAGSLNVSPDVSKMLLGTGKDDAHLLVVMSADRGLCGGFNGNLVRFARGRVAALEAEGKSVKLVVVGRKSRDLLARAHADKIVHTLVNIGDKGGIDYVEAEQLGSYLLEQFNADAFDVCSLIYNDFVNVMTQKPISQQLIPFKPAKDEGANDNDAHNDVPYSFEPSEEALLEKLLPRNLSSQIYNAMLASAAGEQAARMTAMDNATRNAGDMIDRLSLKYNRARQAYITSELIEIISGAEAL